MRHFMSILDLSVQEIEELMLLAKDIENNPKKYANS